MPAIQPNEDPIIVEFDLPEDIYHKAARAAKKLGYASLEDYLYHLVDPLDENIEQHPAVPSD